MRKELFDNIPSKVGDLLRDVRNDKIGLPDLQRPSISLTQNIEILSLRQI